MLLFGVAGYLLNRYDFPVVPMIIGLVLGGELEEQLRLSLTLSGGDPTLFVRQPTAAGLLLLTAAVLVAPAVRAVRRPRGRSPRRSCPATHRQRAAGVTGSPARGRTSRAARARAQSIVPRAMA